MCKRMKLESYLIPYTKINSKYINILNVRPKSIEFLEENIERNLHDLDLGNDLLGITPKAQAT